MFDFKQLIHDFTRTCRTSTSVIDLILTSYISKVSQSGVIHTTFSDHFMTYCTRKVTKPFNGKHNVVNIRPLKNYSKEDFQFSLLSTDWSSVLLSEHTNEYWNNFKTIFLSVLDNIASEYESSNAQNH